MLNSCARISNTAVARLFEPKTKEVHLRFSSHSSFRTGGSYGEIDWSFKTAHAFHKNVIGLRDLRDINLFRRCFQFIYTRKNLKAKKKSSYLFPFDMHAIPEVLPYSSCGNKGPCHLLGIKDIDLITYWTL